MYANSFLLPIDRNILVDALVTFGGTAQALVAIEECSELIKEIAKVENRGKSPDDMKGEVVDVLIAVCQLFILFDENEMNKLFDQKMSRLKNRIEQFKVDGM